MLQRAEWEKVCGEERGSEKRKASRCKINRNGNCDLELGNSRIESKICRMKPR